MPIITGTLGVLMSPQVARQSPTMFVLIMNNCHIEIDVHRLNDGGLLLSYNGSSYTTYMKEEVDRCARTVEREAWRIYRFLCRSQNAKLASVQA